MSEYNMTHTGKELDDAIAKVQSGYVFPDQSATVTKNGIYDTIGEIPVKLIDEIEVAVPVPDGYEIPTLYTGDYNITSNQKLQTAGKKMTSNLTVNVPVPSDYIKIGDTKVFVTQFTNGDYSRSSDTCLSDISISVGFKPKIFVLTNSSGVASNSKSSSKYHLLTSIFIKNNNYNNLLRFSSYLYYNSTSKLYMGGRSTSEANTLNPTDGGVSGNDRSTVYTRANMNYQWYAWG